MLFYPIHICEAVKKMNILALQYLIPEKSVNKILHSLNPLSTSLIHLIY